MKTNFAQTDVIASSAPATVGMFGTDNKYYFYFKFQPHEDWHSTMSLTMTFRLLFQMGSTSSDWSGVRWYDDGLAVYTNKIFTLAPSSCDNSKLSSIATNEGDNSTFYGEIDFNSNEVTILRLIEEDEQTNEDESVIRFEAGRQELKAMYWDKDGGQNPFNIELQGASYISVAAFAMTAFTALLAF
jgi:hypothetical protein